MQRTKIEWVKNPNGSPGYTFNPITGCLNHVNGLCKGGGFLCYAYKLANTRLATKYTANKNTASPNFPKTNLCSEAISDPFYPRFWEERLEQPNGEWHTGYNPHRHKPRGVFVCDMSDLFGIGIPQGWTDKVMGVVNSCRNDRFYLLTKQPQNLIKFSPFPDNAWVGITATNQETYYDGVSNIAKVEAKVKFVSFEPLLERINGGECAEEYRLDSIDEFDWVIIGACTGTYTELVALIQRYPSLELRRCGPNRYVAVPPPGWVREIMSAADAANVPVFIKNNILDTAEGEYRLEGRREMPHATI